MADFYTWSEIHNGGSVEEVQGAFGTRKVVMDRNITPAGEKITRQKLDVDEEQWDAWIASGVIRPYPMPEGADQYTSPTQAVISALTTQSGEIDQDMLLELALSQPLPSNPSAEEAKEVAQTKPVGVK